MRIKNAVEKAGMEGLELFQKRKLAHYGRNCNEEALRAVDMIVSAAWMEDKRDCVVTWKNIETVGNLRCALFGATIKAPRNFHGLDAKTSRQFSKEAWQLVKKYFLAAYDRNDGSFLRDMANAIEVFKNPVEIQTTIIATEVNRREIFREPGLTVPEGQAELKKHGVPAHRKTVKAILERLERKPEPAKRGIKPGSKRNQVHRARL